LLLEVSYGPVVPWIGASIGPGGSDLRLGTEPGAQDRLVERHAEQVPIFFDYQRKTRRRIPVLILKRSD
jgi:hypothetical protein